MLSVNICHESANLYVLNSRQIIRKANMHWVILDVSDISVKGGRCRTSAAPHSSCAASVRSTRGLPVTALWAVLGGGRDILENSKGSLY